MICTTSGGSGTVTASDDFNRADGPLGSNWTAMSDGAMTISSQVVAGGSSGQSGDTRTAETYTSDQYSQVQVTSTQLTGGQWIGPAVRSQSNGNLYVGIYFWNGGSPQLRLYSRTWGSWTQLGSSYPTSGLAAGATLGLTATGSTISFLLNGSPVITVTDTSLTGGAPGIMAYGTARADNWVGGDIGGGASYTIGGTVSGLSGTVVLQDNGGDNLTVTANGSFAFPTQLASGAAYAVTVKTQPSGQTCTVGSGTGTVGSANVTNVAVACTANPPVTYSVGGTVSGLSGTVVLQDNGGDNLTVTANGSFAFPTQLASGAAYAVTVKTQPSGQTCTVGSGTGTVGSANVTNVAVACTANPPVTYSVGGTVSGLSGTVVLQDNGGDNLTVTANGSFAFPTQLASGAAYAVTVLTQPSGQTCTVSSGTGTVGSANITTVAVICTTSGGSGTVTASDDFNRADGPLGSNWTAMSDGAMTISSQVVAGGSSGQSGDTRTAETYTSDQYSQVQVTSTQLTGGQWIGPAVRSQSNGNLYVGIYFWNGGSPQLRLYSRTWGSWTQLGSSYPTSGLAAGATLGLTATGSTISFLLNGSPVITVTDTSLTGGAPGIMAYGTARADNWVGGDIGGGASYTIGGTVSGLSGTLVLNDNGGDALSLTANGPFTFPTSILTGSSYNVTVASAPAGQTCAVSNGSGTVGSGSVTTVVVTCTASSGGGSGLQVQYLSTDASGVQTYQVTSPDNGPGPQNLRVLQPSNPAPGVAHNFLYVLPIAPGDDGGLEVIQSLNLQNQYNLTVIEPSFSINPWYADNPLDANLQEDTFMAMDLQPWVKANLSTTGSEQHWLIGFSKSGIGAQTLILRHPDKFTLAASWDFPADMSAYDEYGTNSSESYGTDANFQANYRLTAAFLAAHAAPFKTNNRIWIGGYQLFQQDMADYDALLTAQGIQHTTETPTAMAHAWDSGWVPIALSALYADSVNLR